MAKLTWHGHATCSLETDDGTHLVIDPFFGDNPACDVSVDEVEADYILVSHGHYDHIADAVRLGKRTGATVIATYEVPGPTPRPSSASRDSRRARITSAGVFSIRSGT